MMGLDNNNNIQPEKLSTSSYVIASALRPVLNAFKTGPMLATDHPKENEWISFKTGFRKG